LINESVIIRVPWRMVGFGNRSGLPIVDQLSAHDGHAADVKFHRERRGRNAAEAENVSEC